MRHIIPLSTGVLVISITSLVIYTEMNRNVEPLSTAPEAQQVKSAPTPTPASSQAAYTNYQINSLTSGAPKPAQALNPHVISASLSDMEDTIDAAQADTSTTRKSEAIPGLAQALAEASNTLSEDELSNLAPLLEFGELISLFDQEGKEQEQQIALKQGLSKVLSASKVTGIGSDQIERLSFGLQQTISKHVEKYKQGDYKGQFSGEDPGALHQAVFEDLNQLAQEEFGVSIEDLAEQLQELNSLGEL